MTNKPTGIDYEYDTGHMINDWRQAAPAGTYLTSTGTNPGWISYQDEAIRAVGGVHLSRQAELRKQHPALQEAWDTYVALLHVCNDK